MKLMRKSKTLKLLTIASFVAIVCLLILSYLPVNAAAPSLTIQAATVLRNTTATANGNITNLNGGGNATTRGFEYDTDSGAPYAFDWHQDGSFGTGTYIGTLTGLTQDTTYYIRAYAINPDGTAYSTETTFITTAENAYWILGSGDWTDLGHWATSTGGLTSIKSLPAVDTNVYFDANSFTGANQTITVPNSTSVYCHDMNWTGATGIPDLFFGSYAGNPTIVISGSVTFINAMTMTNAPTLYRGRLQFLPSSTDETLTTNGLSIPARFYINGTGTGKLTLLDELTVASSTGIELYTGEFDTNGQTVNTTVFSVTGTGVRTTTLGSSGINCTRWVATNVTNMVFDAGTSVISISGDTFAGGSQTYYEVQLNGTAHTISGSNIYTTLTRTGTATQTDSLTLTAGTTQTVTGTFTATGNSATNRLLVNSSSAGSAATITVPAINITASNVDFQDITFTNATDLSGIAGGTIGFSGTTNLTCTYPYDVNDDLYWYGGTGDWDNGLDDMYHWSTSTNGTGGQRHQLPLSTNSIIFDVNSFSGAGSYVTADHINVACNNFTVDAGENDTFTLRLAAITFSVYGDFTLQSNCTISNVNMATPSVISFLATSGSHVITRNGATLNSLAGLAFSFAGNGGTWELADEFVGDSKTTISVNTSPNATFNTNNQVITIGNFQINNSSIVNLGSSVITLNGTTGWSFGGTDYLDEGTSTINITGASTFAGGSTTYSTVNFTGTDIAILSGSNTFASLNIDRTAGAKTVHFTAGTTQTVTSFDDTGAGTALLTLDSTVGGSAWNIVDTLGNNVCDYLTLQDSHASGGARFYAGDNSNDVSGNTGWIFASPPSITTTSASPVTSTTATLFGTLDSLGGFTPVYVYFELATDAYYVGHANTYDPSLTTIEQTKTATATVNQFINGLSNTTTYHYRIACRFVDGISYYIYGSDTTFVTPNYPDVITEEATGYTTTIATLNGTLAYLAGYPSVSVYFEYSSDSYYDAHPAARYSNTTTPIAQTIVTGFSTAITGLIPNVQYHFRTVVSFAGTGTPQYGSDKTFTTEIAPGQSTDISIGNGRVFSNYLATGDMLIVAETYCNYTGYYPKKDSNKYFQVQLLDTTGTNILAATSLWDWGNRPVSIYLNSTLAATLTEGAPYIIRLQGLTPLTAIHAEYTLQPEDWMGTDLGGLDSWMVSVARDMNTFYDWVEGTVNYTLTSITDGGIILSRSGGVYFTSGISQISRVRPLMFAAPTSQPTATMGVANNVYDKQTWISGDTYITGDKVGYNNVVYECILNIAGGTTIPPSDAVHWLAVAGEIWEVQVGSVIATDATTFGNLFNVNGDEWIGFIIWMLIIFIVLYGASKGAGALGMVLLCFPLIIVGNYFRVIGIQITVVTAALSVFLFVRQFWIKTT